MDNEGKVLLLGNETDNPLCYGFNSKRTVHAGLNGLAIDSALTQKAWKKLLDAPVEIIEKQAVYIHIPCRKSVGQYSYSFFTPMKNTTLRAEYVDEKVTIKRYKGFYNLISSTISFLGQGTCPLVPHIMLILHICRKMKQSYPLTLYLNRKACFFQDVHSYNLF